MHGETVKNEKKRQWLEQITIVFYFNPWTWWVFTFYIFENTKHVMKTVHEVSEFKYHAR